MVAPVDASTFDLESYRKDLESTYLSDLEKRVSLWFLNLMSNHPPLAQSWRVLQSPKGRLSVLIQRDGGVPSAKTSFLFDVSVQNGEIVCTVIKHSAKSLSEKINVPLSQVASFLESSDMDGLTDSLVEFTGFNQLIPFDSSDLFDENQFGADIIFTKSRLYSVVQASGQPSTDGDAVGLVLDNSKKMSWTDNLIDITEPTVAEVDFKQPAHLIDFFDAENTIHQQWVEFTGNSVSTYAYMDVTDVSRVMSVQVDVWMLDEDTPPIIGSFSSAATSNLSLVGGLTVIPPPIVKITKIAPFVYRLTAELFGDVTGTGSGVICYAENVFRPFRVSGYNVKFLEGNHFYQDVLTARGAYHTSPEHVSLDAFDDNYISSFPEIVNGQIVIATTTGIWADVFNHAGGAFTIGPDTFTGGPAGLMSLVGNDIIAVFVRNTQLSKPELEKLISKYRTLGAGPRVKLDTSLFANRDGAILDTFDKTVMFKDITGTEPVSQDGDPVGLILDKSKGLVKGAELLDNSPDFESSWVINNASGNASISGNVLTLGNASGDRITKMFPLEVNKSYVFTVKIKAVSGIGSRVRAVFFDSATGLSGQIPQQQIVTLDGSVQTLSLIGHVVDNTSSQIQIRASVGEAVLEILSASLKHLPGHHFFQPINTARLTYRESSGMSWLEGDGVDDFFRFHAININNGALAMAIKDRFAEIGVNTRCVIGQGVGGYIFTGGALRNTGINLGANAYFIDTPAEFSLQEKQAVRINKNQGTISIRNSSDQTEHTNSVAGGATGLTNANALFAFSKNGEIPIKCDFYGMILLSENTTPLEDRLIFQWLNDRSGV